MGWFSKRETRAPDDSKPGKVISKVLAVFDRGRGVRSKVDLEAFVQEGYKQSAIVHACIRELATSAAEPRLIAYDLNGRELPQAHPLSRLLSRPNRETSGYELTERLVTELYTSGNAFLHKNRSRIGLPVELWPFRTSRMEIVPKAKDGTIDHYLYNPNPPSAFGVSKKEARKVPRGDVIHAKLPNPSDDYFGLSPIEVVAEAIDVDNAAITYLRQFFENSATPQIVLQFQEILSDKQRSIRADDWAENFGRRRDLHGVAALDGGAKVQEIGAAPDRLELSSVFGETETRICAVFGVPPVLIGAHVGIVRSTYSNYSTARRSFWEETLMPLYKRLGEKLTTDLAPEFGEGITIAYDLSTVQALQENRNAARDFALRAFKMGAISRAAFLRLSGVEDEGGVALKPANVDPLELPASDNVVAMSNG